MFKVHELYLMLPPTFHPSKNARHNRGRPALTPVPSVHVPGCFGSVLRPWHLRAPQKPYRVPLLSSRHLQRPPKLNLSYHTARKHTLVRQGHHRRTPNLHVFPPRLPVPTPVLPRLRPRHPGPFPLPPPQPELVLGAQKPLAWILGISDRVHRRLQRSRTVRGERRALLFLSPRHLPADLRPNQL